VHTWTCTSVDDGNRGRFYTMYGPGGWRSKPAASASNIVAITTNLCQVLSRTVQSTGCYRRRWSCYRCWVAADVHHVGMRDVRRRLAASVVSWIIFTIAKEITFSQNVTRPVYPGPEPQEQVPHYLFIFFLSIYRCTISSARGFGAMALILGRAWHLLTQKTAPKSWHISECRCPWQLGNDVKIISFTAAVDVKDQIGSSHKSGGVAS